MTEIRPALADAVAIVDGRVSRVGATADLIAEFAELDRLDARGRAVTPGLIDPHTHVVFAGDRSDEFARRCAGETYQEIAGGGGGILKSMRETRACSPARLAELAVPRLAAMLQRGVTTAEVKTGYALSECGEMAMLDATLLLRDSQPIELVPTFMAAHLTPPDISNYVQLCCDKLIEIASRHPVRPRFNDVFCDEGAFTVEEARLILEAGKRHGLKPKIHAEEFAWTGAARLGVELGAASADHLLQANAGDIEALAQSDTVATLLPGTGFYLDLPARAPARAMIEAGCVVAFGSDYNPGSCSILSLPFIMGLGCLQLKMTAAEALCAVTINAAAALDLGPTHGQLAVGMAGDLVIWPYSSLLSLIGDFAQARAQTVVKNGRVAFSE